jgi:hypothetical protein
VTRRWVPSRAWRLLRPGHTRAGGYIGPGQQKPPNAPEPARLGSMPPPPPPKPRPRTATVRIEVDEDLLQAKVTEYVREAIKARPVPVEDELRAASEAKTRRLREGGS